MFYLAIGLMIAVGSYAAVGALLFVVQRKLQYSPETVRTLPATIGLPQARERVIATADNEKIILWEIPPRTGFPVILFLPGNFGALRLHVDRFREVTADGTGLLAVSFRGYGGSSGSPSERGLLKDARALWDYAVTFHDPEELAVWGLSLGAAVGIALAAERPVRRLIVEGAFRSAASIAQRRYPIFPARWCLLDKFDCERLIARVNGSVLFLHGALDDVVPISEAKCLFEKAISPKRFVAFPQGDHNNLLEFSVTSVIRDFLQEQRRDQAETISA